MVQHKESLRVAAKCVRDTNSALKPVDIFSRTTFLGAVSRAVFHQDEKFASSLLAKHPNASETFGFVDGKVTIWDLPAFAEELDKNHSGILERNIRDVEQEFSSLPDTVQNSSKKKGRIEGLRRLINFFISIGRTLALSGVCLPDGVIARGCSMEDALSDGWDPTFMEKDINSEKTTKIVQRFLSKMEWDLASVIDLDAFLSFF